MSHPAPSHYTVSSRGQQKSERKVAVGHGERGCFRDSTGSLLLLQRKVDGECRTPAWFGIDTQLSAVCLDHLACDV